jgi:hypothetical protein
MTARIATTAVIRNGLYFLNMLICFLLSRSHPTRPPAYSAGRVRCGLQQPWESYRGEERSAKYDSPSQGATVPDRSRQAAQSH